MTSEAPKDLLTLADVNEEEVNHQRALDLGPWVPNALDLLHQLLGDISWRVRKAGLVALERFKNEPRIVDTLIAGLASTDNAGLRNACAEGLVMLGESAVSPLIKALETVDFDQRKFVVEALGLIGTPEALKALLGALTQEEANVRSAVVDALGQVGGPTVVAELTRLLRDNPTEPQYTAYILDALARCHAQLSWGELSPWLAHRQLVRFVYPLLGMSKDLESVPSLIAAALHGTRSTRRLALCALAALWRDLGEAAYAELSAAFAQESQFIPTLTAALRDEDATLVEASARLFGLCKQPDVAPELLRICSLRGLEHLGIESVARLGTQVVKPLLDCIDRMDVQAQLLFLDAIESAGDAGAVAALMQISNAESLHVASAAVRVIGHLGGPEIIEPMMAIIRTRDEREICQQAMFALVHVGGRHADEVANAMRRALQAGDVQPAWFSVLGSLRRPADVDVLISGARHPQVQVRRSAVEAAQRLGSLVPEAELMRALRDESALVRVAAARALSAYRSDAVVEGLVQAMHDLDPWVVAESAAALGAVGGKRATQALQQAAGNSIAPIAIAVLQSLDRLAIDDLESSVTRAMEHSEPEVVREALRVATHLGAAFANDVLTKALRHAAWDVRSTAADLILEGEHRVDVACVNDAYEHETEPLVREKFGKLRQALDHVR